MTSHLRHELHAMVDDVPTVDVIDRAIGTAHGLRRRRTGAGVIAAVAVAGALAAPFALVGSGRPPASAGESDHVNCTVPPPANNDAFGSPVGQIIAGHLPPGYPVAAAVTGPWCGSSTAISYTVIARGGGDVMTVLVPRTDRARHLVIDGVAAFAWTNCARLLDPGFEPPWPWGSPSPMPSSVDGTSIEETASPSPSDSWPSWTPSDSPSGSLGASPSGSPTYPSTSPSGSLGASPSGSPIYPSTSPSGSLGASPSGSPIYPSISPSGSAGASPSASATLAVAPRIIFCHDATAKSPMLYAVDTGLSVMVVAIWGDHRGIIVESASSGVGGTPPPVAMDWLVALATDPALLAEVPGR